MESPLTIPPSIDRSGGYAPPVAKLGSVLESIAFWTAVIIPFTYLPILAVESFIPLHSVVFISLIATNIIALLLGHNYSPTK